MTVTVLLTFCCCDKISKKDNLKKEGFILAPGFRGLSPWSAAPLLLGLWWGRSIMVERHGRGKLLPSCGQEVETDGE
jgi:hypothetical protein